MKIEIAIPVWGYWLDPWREYCLPTLALEAADIGASLVVYTDEAGREALRGEITIDEMRPLPPGRGDFDRADAANEDSINRALIGGYAVAPLVAALFLGRGTLVAAARRLEVGYRGVMAALLTVGAPPQPIMPAGPLSFWMAKNCGVLTWDERRTCTHPGHYAWRSGDAILLRPIFIHPVLLAPTRPHLPIRAIDHFMVEGYLDDIGQVSCLDPIDGCMIGIDRPRAEQPAAPPPDNGPKDALAVARWMAYHRIPGLNVERWNLHYMAHRFWFGEPGAGRLATEMASDRIVAETARLYGDQRKRMGAAR